jgi:hypothetical protein
VLSISNQHSNALAEVVHFALQIFAVLFATLALTTLARMCVYVLLTGGSPPRSRPGSSPRSCSAQGSSDARSRPSTIRTDDTPKVRFSATVGEELEVEVGLV